MTQNPNAALRMPMKGVVGDAPIRYAVVNVIHQEVMTQNHQSIGEAFNCAAEEYNTTDGLIVVATQNDIILGEVRRNGALKNNNRKLPKTIWDCPNNLFYDPELTKKITETGKSILLSMLTIEGIQLYE